MLQFILKRVVQALPVLFGILTVVFFLIHMIPGDPVDMMLGDNALPANRDKLRQELGLDQPIALQYFSFMKGVFQLDLGTSIYKKKPVMELIGDRAPATILLALTSIFVALAFALPLGIFAALKRGKWVDHAAMAFAMIGIAMPSFWMGPLLVILFSIKLGWLPVSEMSGPSSFILPSLTLGLSLASMISRMSRSSMLEVLNQDYIQTARAKGLSKKVVVMKHAFKNALVPIITVVGLQVGALLSGAIITETIFDWPGLGSLVFGAIQSRDYPLVQGCVLVIAISYVFINMLTDIAYGIANPKIRFSQQ